MIYTRVIFVTRLSAIGDAIIATRAVQLLALHGYYPVFVTSKSIQKIAESMPYLNAYVCTEKGKESQYYVKKCEIKKDDFIHFIKSVSVEKKPLFLDLQKTNRSKRARNEIKKNIAFEKFYTVPKRTFYRIFLIVISFLCFSQRKRSKDIDFAAIQTIANLQENLIQEILAKDGKQFMSSPSPAITLDDRAYNTDKDYICLFPGASGFIKMWPKENFRAFMDLILEFTKLNIILCGSQLEINIGEYLNFPENTRVFNLINKTNLQQSFGLISGAKYVVTNDSFAVHAAEAFGIPATVLFGATTPKFGFIPKAENINIEYLNLACSPCSRHGKSKCHFKNLKCLREITAQKVFENVIYCLNKPQ